MRNPGSLQSFPPMITTSWDDGHPLDIRLAELLATYGLKGTFYVPILYARQTVLDCAQLRYLRQLGMEIGSHTVTHTLLTEISKERTSMELAESKKRLEDILGEEIQAFCYPGGKFNRAIRSMVIDAGYILGRTTRAFKIELDFDPFLMPVSLQFYPHGRFPLVTHLLREDNFKGLQNWRNYGRLDTDLFDLSKRLVDAIIENGEGVFHLWGHSWEIDENGLWDLLKEVLSWIADKKWLPLTNSEVIKMIAPIQQGH